ncbi:MAG: hypothetical protein B6I24_07555 [Bacteroidetes bacterium 4572_128]|nr:MAG: hypothetical protein B6I24_07555 [Bacteroidetes bacterium 4572_128]
MLVGQKETVDKLISVIKQLSDEKFSQLFNYAIFLMLEEKQIFTEQMFMHYSFSNEDKMKKGNKKLNIPIYSCNGMKQKFNRKDLYGTRI